MRFGGGDSDLDERLSKELGAYNVAASGSMTNRSSRSRWRTTEDWWPV